MKIVSTRYKEKQQEKEEQRLENWQNKIADKEDKNIEKSDLSPSMKVDAIATQVEPLAPKPLTNHQDDEYTPTEIGLNILNFIGWAAFVFGVPFMIIRAIWALYKIY